MSPATRHVVWGLAVVLLVNGCSEDESPRPNGDWSAIAEGSTADDVEWTIWSTEATREDAECLSLDLSPPPAVGFTDLPASTMYRGRVPSCFLLPDGDRLATVIGVWESPDDDYRTVLGLARDGTIVEGVTAAGVELADLADEQEAAFDVFFFVLKADDEVTALSLERSGTAATCEIEVEALSKGHECIETG